MTARITRPVLVPGAEPTDDVRLEQARVGAKLCAAEMALRVRLARRMARAESRARLTGDVRLVADMGALCAIGQGDSIRFIWPTPTPAHG